MNQEVLKQRTKLFHDAIQFQKPERVPHVSNFFLWFLSDAGIPVTQGCRDHQRIAQMYRTELAKYPFDSSCSVYILGSMTPRIIDPIGPGLYSYNDATGDVSLKDLDLLKGSELDLLAKDPVKATFETMLPRKFPNWKELTVAELAQSMQEYVSYMQAFAQTNELMYNEFDMPKEMSMFPVSLGMEDLFYSYLGMKETSLAMRRHPDAVQAAVDTLESGLDAQLSMLKKENRPEGYYIFDTLVGLVGHNYVNRKQWEWFYWPTLKKILDHVVAEDLTIKFNQEGSVMLYADYLKDYDKGHICVWLDVDDPYTIRQALPNVCIMGGMRSDVLSQASPEECVNEARRLIDDLGREGGFILAQDKMMTYGRDCKPENLKAVCQFAQDYVL